MVLTRRHSAGEGEDVGMMWEWVWNGKRVDEGMWVSIWGCFVNPRTKCHVQDLTMSCRVLIDQMEAGFKNVTEESLL